MEQKEEGREEYGVESVREYTARVRVKQQEAGGNRREQEGVELQTNMIELEGEEGSREKGGNYAN